MDSVVLGKRVGTALRRATGEAVRVDRAFAHPTLAHGRLGDSLIFH